MEDLTSFNKDDYGQDIPLFVYQVLIFCGMQVVFLHLGSDLLQKYIHNGRDTNHFSIPAGFVNQAENYFLLNAYK